MTNQADDKISSVLLGRVQAPAQYIGGEVNEIRKDPKQVDTTVALAFPDTYAIGMSHLGSAILYAAVNQMPNVAAERVFCPWVDAERVMRDHGIGLFCWESRRGVRDCDILGITLQHELAYSNVLYLLDMGQITLRAADRGEGEPLVIAGGPIADCCEPVADFLDAVILGDGEEALPAVISAYRRLRKAHARRRELLLELAREFPYVYVPQFYHVEYAADGTVASCEPTEKGVRRCVERAVVEDLDAAVFCTEPIVAHTETVHDRIAIEIMRGCPQRCAFCHAGHTKGPVRCRSIERIVDLAWQGYLATGHDTLSLLSLSSSDYPDLSELVGSLRRKFEGRRVGISLPSLRVDEQLRDVPAQVAGVRREGLTLAIEAASARIRKAIGKRLTDEQLFETLRQAYQAGWQKVKLYFMVGFPGEREEDILGIVELAGRVSSLARQVSGRSASVNAAVSWLVPKPHTPLAWMGQRTAEYCNNAKRLILQAKRSCRGVQVNFKFHHVERSQLEGVFARGDRRLSRVLEIAYRNGARFDSWSETFDYGRYLAAFGEAGLDPAFYSQRERGADEMFVSDHLGSGNRGQLYDRYKRIMQMLSSESAQNGQ